VRLVRSAVYAGRVVHHRRHPIDHSFTYRLALPLVYLDEMQELCRLHPLWSTERANVVSYRRADYLRPDSVSLEAAVRDVVQERLGWRPSGPIAMLAHPRTWGWVFNPIAMYYCFDPSASSVEALVAEVTNTPWHERHAYAVGAPGTHRFPKELHVSPFFGMDLEYALSYGSPGRALSVRIDLCDGGSQVFHAGLHLERRDANRKELGRLIWSYPFMTARVSAAIYRQAFALRRGGAPFVAHPRRQCEAVETAGIRRIAGSSERSPSSPFSARDTGTEEARAQSTRNHGTRSHG
jgi:uncharacterized protein